METETRRFEPCGDDLDELRGSTVGAIATARLESPTLARLADARFAERPRRAIPSEGFDVASSSASPTSELFAAPRFVDSDVGANVPESAPSGAKPKAGMPPEPNAFVSTELAPSFRAASSSNASAPFVSRRSPSVDAVSFDAALGREAFSASRRRVGNVAGPRENFETPEFDAIADVASDAENDASTKLSRRDSSRFARLGGAREIAPSIAGTTFFAARRETPDFAPRRVAEASRFETTSRGIVEALGDGRPERAAALAARGRFDGAARANPSETDSPRRFAASRRDPAKEDAGTSGFLEPEPLPPRREGRGLPIPSRGVASFANRGFGGAFSTTGEARLALASPLLTDGFSVGERVGVRVQNSGTSASTARLGARSAISRRESSAPVAATSIGTRFATSRAGTRALDGTGGARIVASRTSFAARRRGTAETSALRRAASRCGEDRAALVPIGLEFAEPDSFGSDFDDPERVATRSDGGARAEFREPRLDVAEDAARRSEAATFGTGSRDLSTIEKLLKESRDALASLVRDGFGDLTLATE